MKFVITSYGEDYLPFLYTCLESIYLTQSNPGCKVLLKEVGSFELKLLQNFFPKANFLLEEEVDLYKGENIHKKISQKLEFWEKLISNEAEDEIICFIDVDTLVIKNLDYIADLKFDFIYTWKDEQYPINTGVVVVKNSSKIRSFIKAWRVRTNEIITNDVLLQEALETYGGGDQKALADLLEEVPPRKSFTKKYSFGEIEFEPRPCSELNETNSVPVNSGAKILHYKAGWHPIILKEQPFTELRPEATSYEMLSFWENMYANLNESKFLELTLSVAEKYKSKLNWDKQPYEHRGIPHSEMLAVVALVDFMDIDVIIESGRCRGQSTQILAEAFKNTDKKIISIELNKDENADFAENRLKKYNKLELLYGDAFLVLKEQVEKYKDKKIAVLCDGPKGTDAFILFSEVISEYDNVVLGFFHDLNKLHRRKINRARLDINFYYDRVIFTDNEKYVKAFRGLDKKYIVNKREDFSLYTWADSYKGWDMMGSYGPTLGIVFPTVRDRLRARKAQNSSSSSIVDQPLISTKVFNKLKRAVYANIKKIKK